MSGGWETAAVVSAIALVLGRIAWRDGARFEVGWVDVLMLAALGVWWQGAGAWASILGGIGLGAGGVAALIALWRWRGRRAPAFAGDVMLLGAAGAVLGPAGVAVSMVLNLPVGLAYRWWLAHRRGRRGWLQGYVPMGPAYCLSAGVVLVWQAVVGRHG